MHSNKHETILYGHITVLRFAFLLRWSPNPVIASDVYGPELDSKYSTACNLFHGIIQCWGFNYWQGDLPSDVTTSFDLYGSWDLHTPMVNPYDTSTNQDPFDGAKPVQIGTGNMFIIVLLDNSKVYGWGTWDGGALGLSAKRRITATPFPIQIHSHVSGKPEHLTDVVEIDAGLEHACAVHTNRSMTCWGSNSFGESTSINHYDGLSDDTKVKHVACGSWNTCVVSMDNIVQCFGRDSPSNFIFAASHNVLAIRMATPAHGCIILDKSDDNVLCFGQNNYGQLGNGQTSSLWESPISPHGLGHAVHIGTGYGRSCAVLDNNSQKCWGLNNPGFDVRRRLIYSLGSASTNNYESTPQDVIATSGIHLGDSSILGIHVSTFASFLHLSGELNAIIIAGIFSICLLLLFYTF